MYGVHLMCREIHADFAGNVRSIHGRWYSLPYNRAMRPALVIAAAVILPVSAVAQGEFSPTLPATIPPVEGTVTVGAALRFIDTQAGTGDLAAPGKRFTVHYTGWLRDGTLFDSSRNRNEPIDFVQGRRQVIAGWDVGFEGMKVGGKRRLFIPPQLAYGAAGSGPIPPNAELVFDVELLKVEDAPVTAPAADLLFALADLEKKYLALAKAVPEDKLSWRPNDQTRSFSEVLVHVAEDNHLLREMSGGKLTDQEAGRRAQESAKLEKVSKSKDELITSLARSFAEVRQTL